MYHVSLGEREMLWKQRGKKEKNNLLTLIIKMEIIFAHAIIASTARASSVFLWNYGNTIFNQSARLFSYDCFLNVNIYYFLTLTVDGEV